MEIGEFSDAAGKTLAEIGLRRKTGAEVAAIRRGGFSIYDIGASTRLFPEDIVVLCATESEISAAEEILSKVSSRNFNEDALSGEIVLDTLEIKKGSFLDGKTLSEASMPGKYGVKVVDVMLSGGSEPSKPNPSERLGAGDRLLCMGVPQSIVKMAKDYGLCQADKE